MTAFYYSKFMAKLNAIFAHGLNGEFSLADGSLPWKGKPELNECAKKDMQHFKNTTLGHIVIMGFNTYGTFSRPLTGRINVVIDRTKNSTATISENDFNFFSSLEDAIDFFSRNKFSQKKIFLIGGAKLLEYAFTKNLIDGTIYETVFNHEFPGATVFMPKLPLALKNNVKTFCFD